MSTRAKDHYHERTSTSHFHFTTKVMLRIVSYGSTMYGSRDARQGPAQPQIIPFWKRVSSAWHAYVLLLPPHPTM